MNFPIVIHKDRGSDYGVTVPDLPGCFTAGSTLDEALAMAQEAIELHLEGLIEQGQAVPRPGAIEDYRDSPDYKGGVWAIVSVSPSRLRVKARRINVSIPQRVLEAVDRFAKAENETRSGLLAKAATAYIRQTPLRPRRRRVGQKK
ncbi:MAG: type II toxin-antitoxin system HicB family antitoxin [Planctomycetota bacterium]|nr:type II toxin-antitoxin system HicB family antitoxin [Planctomycetota bacterium]